MYGIVAYVRHNNHAGSPVLGIPAPDKALVRMEPAYYPFLWFKTHGCEKLIGNINVCININMICLPTCMNDYTVHITMTFLY